MNKNLQKLCTVKTCSYEHWGATESVLINKVSIIDQVSMKQDLTVGLFYMYVKWQLWKDWEYMEKGKDLIT